MKPASWEASMERVRPSNSHNIPTSAKSGLQASIQGNQSMGRTLAPKYCGISGICERIRWFSCNDLDGTTYSWSTSYNATHLSFQWCDLGTAKDFLSQNENITRQARIRLVCSIYNGYRNIHTLQVQDVAHGLKYLHGLKIIHGDLKPVRTE